MDQVASKDKSNALQCIVKVPQKIGRTILSVQSSTATDEDDDDDDDDDKYIKKWHAIICKNIIDDQKGRQDVRESQLQCLQEIIDHLNLFVYENPESNYERWITSLHPDNVKNNNEGGGKIIDHRFYMKDSDHRKLWNKYMEKLCRESTVEVRSIEPIYKRTLEPDNCDILGQDCWFCPY